MADTIIEKTKERMAKSLEIFNKDLATVRTGRANSALLERIEIEYYGFSTPITQIASITVPEPRQILVKPYELEFIKEIEKAVRNANLGYTPVIDGDKIRINIPILTEERRKEMTKYINKITEDAKVSIRNIRRDSNDILKKDKALSEDSRKRLEKQIQDATDEFINKVDSASKAKEKDIMTI